MTFHERPIKAHGWTGYGYSIVDPETGAGAYLIEGRGNGGVLAWLSGLASGVAIGASVAIIIASLVTLTGGMAILAGVLLGIIFLSYAIAAMAYVLNMYSDDEDLLKCAIGGLTAGIAMAASNLPHWMSIIYDFIIEISSSGSSLKECRG